MLPGQGGRKIALFSMGGAVLVMSMLAFTYRQEIIFRYELWRNFESIGRNPQGYPEYRHRQTGMIFVKLPVGSFWMGAQSVDPQGRNHDPHAHHEGPVHGIHLKSFLVAKYEVTNAQWNGVFKKNRSLYKGDDLPVEGVSLNECMEFCKKLELRLPTDAQWEYACRGETASPFAGTGNLDDMGWYSSNSGYRTHPVGLKKPNHFGLYDMHGNVWEWCGAIPGSGIQIRRGGSCRSPDEKCRSTSRGLSNPSERTALTGLRPCFNLSP